MSLHSHYELKDISSLRPQAFNSQQYDSFESTISGEFLESVKELGVIVPLAVTKTGLILSGHRRYAAAQKAGLSRVPCNIYDSLDDYEKQRLAYDCNLHHQRTVEEQARRVAIKRDIEANRRKQAGESGAPIIGATVMPSGRKATPLEEVAKAEGIGKHKAAQMVETVAIIDDLEAKGDKQTADEIRNVMETKSVNAAHKAAVATVAPPAPPAPVADEEFDDTNYQRTWTKSDATEFRRAFATIIRKIDQGIEMELLTTAEHKKHINAFREFGNTWQKQFSELEWL